MSDELSLEKLRINDRLQAVELQTARLVAHLESETGTLSRLHVDIFKSLTKAQEILDKHHSIILGDGQSMVGILTRLDRLEQIEQDRKWTFRAIWTAIIGIIAKMGIDLLNKN